ncbi:MAG: flagellar motor switch protein FliG [Pseudomonadota bacterium]
METIQNANDLKGAERAAVVMLALGEEASRPLWESLDEDELRELTRAISTLGTVRAEVVEDLLLGFVDNLASTGAIMGSTASAQRMLRSILPADKANLILEDIKGPAGKTMWDKLSNVNERVLCGYLSSEHPQTIAVILARISPDQAARVLSGLPDLLAEEVVARMLNLGPVQKEVLEQIEQTLRTEFMATLSRGVERDRHEAMAEIFNNFDRHTERRFLEVLDQKNPSASERIRTLMFVFEDLVRLSSPDMQTLIRHVDKSDLAMALKGAAPEVAQSFYDNMSDRASKILRDDIDIMGPVRLREVDTAQQGIVDQARKLAEEGEIFLSKTSDEELVY